MLVYHMNIRKKLPGPHIFICDMLICQHASDVFHILRLPQFRFPTFLQQSDLLSNISYEPRFCLFLSDVPDIVNFPFLCLVQYVDLYIIPLIPYYFKFGYFHVQKNVHIFPQKKRNTLKIFHNGIEITNVCLLIIPKKTMGN